MVKNSHTEYCSNLSKLERYLSGIDHSYSPNLLRLFASCSEYGTEMLKKGGKSGVLALLGKPCYLKKTVGKEQKELSGEVCRDLVSKYGKQILLDRDKTLRVFEELGKSDVDGAIFFDTRGNLIGVGEYLNQPDIDMVNGELEIAMRIKGNKEDSIGTRHLAALYATSISPVEAVATSEGRKHTTMAIKDGKISRELVYDPETGLYGLDLFRHLKIGNKEVDWIYEPNGRQGI